MLFRSSLADAICNWAYVLFITLKRDRKAIPILSFLIVLHENVNISAVLSTAAKGNKCSKYVTWRNTALIFPTVIGRLGPCKEQNPDG